MPRVEIVPLAPKHQSLRVSADGMLGRIADGRRQDKGQRYMVAEFLKHLHTMADAYYAGRAAVVDEFCQLYCLDDKRDEAVRRNADATR